MTHAPITERSGARPVSDTLPEANNGRGTGHGEVMDLSFLTPLYEVTGPVASVYVDTTRADENGAQEIDLRWRAARKELADDGADDATLDAIEQVIGTHTDVPGRTGQAVFASEGRVLFDRALSTPPRRELARWSRLPHVMPLLAQGTAVVPHVIVLADRIGAEVVAVGADRENVAVREITGQKQYARKINAGGWSQRRYQHVAEETWKANASQVAEQVDELTRTIGAKVLVAAGDVRARQTLREQLPPRAQTLLVEVEEGGTAPGADREALDAAIEQAVMRTLAEQEQGVVDRFLQERGRQEAAVEGLDATLDALRRAQVETLIVVDDPRADGRLWTASDPTMVASSADELRSLGADDVFEDRADAVLVRAAAGTGAQLLVAVHGQVDAADGVGAILRYSDAATNN